MEDTFDLKLLKTFVTNIKLKKDALGWSVDKLSKEANMPKSTLDNIFLLRNKGLRLSTAVLIANALECTVDELITDLASSD